MANSTIQIPANTNYLRKTFHRDGGTDEVYYSAKEAEMVHFVLNVNNEIIRGWQMYKGVSFTLNKEEAEEIHAEIIAANAILDIDSGDL